MILLEDAILREIESFLLELGGGFAFLARQKRLSIDSDDFYLDLLFYHRRLKRLVAIDLKLGDFKPNTKARWNSISAGWPNMSNNPARKARSASSSAPGKKQELLELLELGQSGIHVAEYLTALPPRELLQQKLHAAIEISRARLENKEGGEP